MPRKSYKQTKKAIHQANVDKLDNLGQLESSFEEVIAGTVEDILASWIEETKAKIVALDLPVTGKIGDIDLQGKEGGFTISANPQLVYQNAGVNGAKNKKYKTPHQYTDKKPPVQPILEWIKRKNLNKRNNPAYNEDGSPFAEVSEEKQQMSLAYAIREKIYQDGFKPNNFLDYESLVKRLEEVIPDLTIQYITQAVDLVNPATKRISTRK